MQLLYIKMLWNVDLYFVRHVNVSKVLLVLKTLDSLFAVAVFLQGRAKRRHAKVDIILCYTHGRLDS